MCTTKANICTMLLFTVSLAAQVLSQRKINIIPCHKSGINIPCEKAEFNRIAKIEHEVLAFPLLRQGAGEDVEYAVNKSESGFGTVTSVGVSVQIGTTAELKYDITVVAVSSSRIAAKDAEFESVLTSSERETYRRAKTSYGGGLRIPFLFLGFLGINLGGKPTPESMSQAASKQRNYNTKSRVAEKILEDIDESTINIKGKLTACGVSFIPVTAQAFIKVARITFNDGGELRVVTADQKETVAADQDGNTVPSEGETINIFEF